MAQVGTVNGVKVYPVTNNIIDVFVGEGWKHWSRWYIKGSIIQHLSGLKLQVNYVRGILK